MRTGPTTSPPGADVLAGVRGAQGLLDTAGSDPSALVLVRGRSGSGKSLVLTVIREHLIARGHDVVTTVAAAETGDAVLVIDGAHTLPADDLAALHRLVQRNDRGVVVAVEPRPHDPALCALGTTMQTLGSVFDLGALTPADIADRPAPAASSRRPRSRGRCPSGPAARSPMSTRGWRRRGTGRPACALR